MTSAIRSGRLPVMNFDSNLMNITVSPAAGEDQLAAVRLLQSASSSPSDGWELDVDD